MVGAFCPAGTVTGIAVPGFENAAPLLSASLKNELATSTLTGLSNGTTTWSVLPVASWEARTAGRNVEAGVLTPTNK